MLRAVGLLFLFLTLPIQAQIQAVAPSTQNGANQWNGRFWQIVVHRDPDATQSVQRALDALGGADAISKIQDWTAHATIDPQQGNPEAPGTAIWKISGSESRTDMTTSQGTYSTVSGRGKPYVETPSATYRLPIHSILAEFYSPFVAQELWRQFVDPKCSFEFLGPRSLNGKSVIVIKTSSQASLVHSLVTPQVWYFDADTGLPVRVDYKWPDKNKAGLSVELSVVLSDYEAKNGILFPFGSIVSLQNSVWRIDKVTEIEMNTSLAPSLFDAKEGLAK